MPRFILALSVVLMSWCGVASGEGISPFRATPLKVGVSTDAPPMVFQIDGRLEGVEIDFARLLGKELGRPVQFVEVPWVNLIPSLQNGDFDIIMSNMTVTADREEMVTFTKPYIEYGQMALVRTTDRTRYPTAKDVMETRGAVAVVGGTTGETFVRKFFPNARVVVENTPTLAMRAVMNKQADVFVYDSPVVLWMSSEYKQDGVDVVNINLTAEYLAWGVRKDDASLLKSVNEALAKLQASGELDRVLDRWLPARPKNP